MPGIESRYAEALIDIARARGELDEFGRELSLVAEIWSGDGVFRNFVLNPVIKPELKKDLLSKAFNGRIKTELLNFMYLLIDNNRVSHLGSIAAAYRRMAEKIGNILHLEVISAEPLTEDQLERLKDIYRKEYGADGIRADVRTDSSLIGGVMVKIGDKVIDSTILGRLKQLKSVMET